MLAFRKIADRTLEGMHSSGIGHQARRGTRRAWGVAVVAGSVAALGLAGQATAAIVTKKDNEGRPITFDVRAENVDTKWYANLLRNATHGDEIANVTIRIVPPSQLVQHCGPGASGCYGGSRRGGRIVVPAGRDADIAHTLIHEYGHHIDRSRTHRGLREPNGTPAWWAARKMGIRVKRGKVGLDYLRGWDRSIGEIFAEDYAQTQLGTRYAIPWLPRPDAKVRAALERDLGALPAKPAQPDVAPKIIKRSGQIRAGDQRALPFGLLGPGRRVTYTVRIGGSQQAGTRARLELACRGATVTKPVRRGKAVARIDRRNLGPGSCQARLVNTSGSTLSYDITLRLAIQK